MTATQIDQLATIRLDSGDHPSPEDGMCLLEAIAYVTGEPFSDEPTCVSPVIATFGRSWNDALSEEDRNRLLPPLAPLLIGTRTTDADEETRAWMATDWLARVNAPAWLRLAGLTREAEAIEATARIVDAITAGAAQPALSAAESAAESAAWSAARNALRPTVETLQSSAGELLRAMCDVGREAI